MSTGEFFKVLSMMMLIVAMVGGIGYWIRRVIKKVKPNFKFWMKYEVLRMKHKQEDVEMLMDDFEKCTPLEKVEKGLLLNGKANSKKAKELVYIYQSMLKLKGGEIR